MDVPMEIRCRMQGWVEGVAIHGLVTNPLLNSETFLFHFDGSKALAVSKCRLRLYLGFPF